MTSRTKLIVGLCVVASIALFLKLATFPEWSSFVTGLLPSLSP